MDGETKCQPFLPHHLSDLPSNSLMGVGVLIGGVKQPPVKHLLPPLKASDHTGQAAGGRDAI